MKLRVCVQLDQESIDAILQPIRALAAQVTRMDAATQTAINNLMAQVNAETNVEQAIKTTLEGMAAQIAALGQGVSDPAVLAAINAAADIVKTNNAKIAADIVANTTA